MRGLAGGRDNDIYSGSTTSELYSHFQTAILYS